MARTDTTQRNRPLTVAADVSNLARLRQHVACAVGESGASDDVIEELQLVVSELATNAMHCHDGDDLTVVIRGDEFGWTLDVSNADGLIELHEPVLPDPTELSGRGLFLVDAIMDRVHIVDIDGCAYIRCVKYAG